ncbi:YceI family protein [Streptomyces fructofermentans]|uniref:Lipid/polyisoprenoid-binding YceI-like domain-containing protein n=1 Tax=Streptomyces fructofermentans TaxID=152141 RepID=A0A918K8P9_9ACTN|nr:YceI family protein [Streptomyces fructofermentans]GGX55143.1 hypothetical protein GCM10010515_23320 [Streptomyces fructofermentans]
MVGNWRGNRTNRGQREGHLTTVTVPAGAGVLGGRVLDPADQPLRHAEFTVADASGRELVGGGLDPFGSFMVTVPAGEYQVEVSADGYAPCLMNATVTEGELAPLGDVTLSVARPPALPGPGDWEIEPGHSSITFTARHIGLARVRGRFNTFAGVIRMAEHAERSAMHVVIDASSVDTNMRRRDEHLRSADFLDVARFPTLEFYSERFTHQGGSRWSVTGDLSLRGVTRTVGLDAEYLGIGNGMDGEVRAACRATAELRRDDFALNWQTVLTRGVGAIGPRIAIDLDVQIVPKT